MNHDALRGPEPNPRRKGLVEPRGADPSAALPGTRGHGGPLHSPGRGPLAWWVRSRPAFTLLELLIVVAVIALLTAILLPALQSGRAATRATVCQSNQRQILLAMHAYAGANADAVVPSYNSRGAVAGVNNPLDGWGPILHAGRFLVGNMTLRENVLVCPDTLDVAGMAAAQTGTDPRNPRGYMDWPAVLTLSAAFARPLPERGFGEVLRVGYWINGDNPLGVPRRFTQGVHFTGSVGFGPDPSGQLMKANRLSAFREAARLIAIADGLYAGNQEAPRHGQRDARVGYRHPKAGQPACNLAFADGHATSILSRDFPRKWVANVAGLIREDVRMENVGPATVYADLGRDLPPP